MYDTTPFIRRVRAAYHRNTGIALVATGVISALFGWGAHPDLLTGSLGALSLGASLLLPRQLHDYNAQDTRVEPWRPLAERASVTMVTVSLMFLDFALPFVFLTVFALCSPVIFRATSRLNNARFINRFANFEMPTLTHVPLLDVPQAPVTSDDETFAFANPHRVRRAHAPTDATPTRGVAGKGSSGNESQEYGF